MKLSVKFQYAQPQLLKTTRNYLLSHPIENFNACRRMYANHLIMTRLLSLIELESIGVNSHLIWRLLKALLSIEASHRRKFYRTFLMIPSLAVYSEVYFNMLDLRQAAVSESVFILCICVDKEKSTWDESN